jgi:4-hydroxybenzoate polyprenyltransferase
MDVFIPSMLLILIFSCITLGIMAWSVHPYLLLVVILFAILFAYEVHTKKEG